MTHLKKLLPSYWKEKRKQDRYTNRIKDIIDYLPSIRDRFIESISITNVSESSSSGHKSTIVQMEVTNNIATTQSYSSCPISKISTRITLNIAHAATQYSWGYTNKDGEPITINPESVMEIYHSPPIDIKDGKWIFSNEAKKISVNSDSYFCCETIKFKKSDTKLNESQKVRLCRLIERAMSDCSNLYAHKVHDSFCKIRSEIDKSKYQSIEQIVKDIVSDMVDESSNSNISVSPAGIFCTFSINGISPIKETQSKVAYREGDILKLDIERSRFNMNDATGRILPLISEVYNRSAEIPNISFSVTFGINVVTLEFRLL